LAKFGFDVGRNSGSKVHSKAQTFYQKRLKILVIFFGKKGLFLYFYVSKQQQKYRPKVPRIAFLRHYW
jgi:hypothetical protein